MESNQNNNYGRHNNLEFTFDFKKIPAKKQNQYQSFSSVLVKNSTKE